MPGWILAILTFQVVLTMAAYVFAQNHNFAIAVTVVNMVSNVIVHVWQFVKWMFDRDDRTDGRPIWVRTEDEGR